MYIKQSMMELIGNTPMVELCRMEKKHGLKAQLCAKLEGFNPGGSAKDRVALNMILTAEASGKLKPGGAVIEPTSGNTGIGIAAICALRGYRAIIVMPDSMSVERQRLIAAYGAELVLTSGAEGMSAAVKKAEEIHASQENSIIAGQFENPANPAAHYRTTGPEIWNDTENGYLSALVAGIGTGGTISGAGKYLKEQNPNIQIIGVEPAESPMLTQGVSGPHGIQGIGANFVPEALDRSVVDEVMTIETEKAMETARDLARTEGLLCGISGGAALCAAMELAKSEAYAGKRIVVILPDTGERYLSSELFA